MDPYALLALLATATATPDRPMIVCDWGRYIRESDDDPQCDGPATRKLDGVGLTEAGSPVSINVALCDTHADHLHTMTHGHRVEAWYRPAACGHTECADIRLSVPSDPSKL